MDTEVVGGGVRRRTPPFGSYETNFRRISTGICDLSLSSSALYPRDLRRTARSLDSATRNR